MSSVTEAAGWPKEQTGSTPLRRVLAGIQFLEFAIWGGLLYYVSTRLANTWDSEAIFAGLVLTGMAALHGAAGFGLALVRAWGTRLQAVAASIGLVRFPFGTITSIVTLLSLKRLNDAAAQWGRIAVIVTTWVLWQLEIFLLVSPAMIASYQRDNTRDTMSSLGALRAAANEFRSRNGHYPQARTLSELVAQLPPDQRPVLEERDAWGTPFRIFCDGSHCVMVSAAADREFERADARWYIGQPREGFGRWNHDRDLVVVDDTFVRFPDVVSGPDAAAPGPAARP